MTPDPLGGHLGNPQSLDRYAYVLNNPATLTDPAGLCGSSNPFIPGGSDCDPLADPFCICDPTPGVCCDPALGCPTVLLLRGPGTPLFGQVEVDLSGTRLQGKPLFAHCLYLCAGVDAGTVTAGEHYLGLTALIKACGPAAAANCPREVDLVVSDVFVFGLGISRKETITGCSN